MYTMSESHGTIFNVLLNALKSNDVESVKSKINSLKLTCWGVFDHCDITIQRQFAINLKNIICDGSLKRLWLRYAGINEFVLNQIIEALDESPYFTEWTVERMLLNEDGQCLSALGSVIGNHIGIERVKIGWNMASIPQKQYYMDLLRGIGGNRCNLKAVELYADYRGTLNVLGTVLESNTVIENVTLNLMDWTENGYDDNVVVALCDKYLNVMERNQQYLRLQIATILDCLKAVCGFPEGLCGDMLRYLFPSAEQYKLCVRVVMNSNDVTNAKILQNAEKKLKGNAFLIDSGYAFVGLLRRDLEFKVGKSWPG